MRRDRCRFAVAATVDFTDVIDHPYLHQYDFKLLADFLANSVFATTADAVVQLSGTRGRAGIRGR